MKAHVSSILLGVRDMDRAKQFFLMPGADEGRADSGFI